MMLANVSPSVMIATYPREYDVISDFDGRFIRVVSVVRSYTSVRPNTGTFAFSAFAEPVCSETFAKS